MPDDQALTDGVEPRVVNGGGLVVYVPAVDSRVDQARARLALARQRTRVSLSVLRSRVETSTDWHTWYRARPFLFLAAAFAAGFLLARRR